MSINFNSIVVDGHNDTLMHIIHEDTWLPILDIGNKTKIHIDIGKLKSGGINVPFFSAFTEGYHNNFPRSISRTLALINGLYWTEKNNLDEFQIAKSVEEIERIVSKGKIGAVGTIEGAYSLNKENAIALLRQYYDLGIRVLGFNWNYSNELGEGASRVYSDELETPSSGGLTELGEEVVLEMNKLGMAIDVSHMDEGTFWDIIRISKAPIIASHSGVYSLRNHVRNLKDDQLKALRENRGVIGVVLYSKFLKDSETAYVKDFVDHIDYAVNLIGVDHVGIGSDFDGATSVEDVEDASEFYKIREELVKRNYKEKDIKKILGGNMLRVLREVENIGKTSLDSQELALNIIPDYKMGEEILDATPLLRARVENRNNINMDGMNYTIIVDGIYHRGEYDKEGSTMFFKIGEALREKFHVVTFEISNSRGDYKRESRIFYNKLARA